MSLFLERRELLAPFRAGHRPALESVYRHYAPVVASFLGRGFSFQSRERSLHFAGFSQPFDVDNGLQETFVRAFKESARIGYDGLRPYKSYLLAIARKLVIDQLRAREFAAGDASEVYASAEAMADGDLGEGGTSAEQSLLRGELGQLYSSFVAGLSERDRCFFEGRFEQQSSQVDAGARIGLSHMQARSLEKKLRVRFLAFMHARGYLQAYGAASAPLERGE